jgi:hypothetical protein
MEDARNLYHLVYASAAAPGFGLTDLEEILKVAREHNSRAGVTGMLLFEGTSFLQVLEGPIGVLDPLMERIRLDPRHDGAVLLLREPIDERSFNDWTMGYTELTLGELQDVSALNDFFRDHSSFTELDDAKVRRILALFREGAFRKRVQ